MKIKEIKGWPKLNSDFGKWFNSQGCPSWIRQRNWLSKELIKRKFIEEKQIYGMWHLFETLTGNCSDWKFQNKILSLVILCLDQKIGEEIKNIIK